MARTVNRLTAEGIKALSTPGYYADGGHLYLQVAKGGSKSWVFRYRRGAKARDMGLGSLLNVSLKDARRKAADCRSLLDRGEDPLSERHAKALAARLLAAKARTFEQCAKAYIESHSPGWRNAKHAAQWTTTLTTYAYPEIGPMPVQDIETEHVMRVIEPLWRTKTETASRLRGRIESVLDWARANQYRTGENPARWRGHLDKLLPKRSKVAAVRNHPALPYVEVAAFMAALRERETLSARALEFVILTAARVSEAVNATWNEIDLEARVWTVPASRMKAKREHRVPLAPAAVSLLRKLAETKQSEFVFPGWRESRPLSGNAVLKLLADMGRGDLTVHGFRSTFRDWAAEATTLPRELAEAALAHVIPDKTEAAYRRGDMLERRALMMEAWATYCATSREAATVTPLRAQQA